MGGANDNRNSGGRKTGEKWKFRGARRRKNAARYWSIDTLLRRLRCLRESSWRKNTPANRSGRILLGVEETPRGTPYRRFSDLLSRWLLVTYEILSGKLGSRNVTSTWSNRTGYCVTTLVCLRKTITERKRGNGKREKEKERGEEKKETVTDLEETRRNYVALRAYKSQVRI